MSNGSPVISNCRFIDNEAYWGAGIYISWQSEPDITGCEFSGNFAQSRGAALYCGDNTTVSLTNCTITDNHATTGGGIVASGGELTLCNTIISFSTQGEAVAVFYNPEIYIYYCDIYGNTGGDWTSYIRDYLGSLGNVSLDPIYRGLFEGDYWLDEDSPCIDSGDPQTPEDPDGTRADMGAYYYNQLTGIYNEPPIPSISMLNQNYPNPFNAFTTISFSLSNSGFAKLAVYDLMGKEVAILFDGFRQAGVYRIEFNASKISSGVYFYRLKMGDAVESRRMVFLK